MKMKLKSSLLIGFVVMSLGAHAQTTNYFSYDFTINPDYTLNNAYIIDTEPSEAFAYFFPVAGNFAGGASGSSVQGSIQILGNLIGPQYLTLIGTFSDPGGNHGVAMSMSNSLASSLIPGASWATFDTSTYFGFLTLPDELTTSNYLATGQASSLFSFNYFPANTPVLNGPASTNHPTSGTIVAFDGAENLGSFDYSITPIPEPASALVFVTGLGLLACRMKRKSALKTS
jgi:hypothetical protein